MLSGGELLSGSRASSLAAQFSRERADLCFGGRKPCGTASRVRETALPHPGKNLPRERCGMAVVVCKKVGGAVRRFIGDRPGPCVRPLVPEESRKLGQALGIQIGAKATLPTHPFGYRQSFSRLGIVVQPRRQEGRAFGTAKPADFLRGLLPVLCREATSGSESEQVKERVLSAHPCRRPRAGGREFGGRAEEEGSCGVVAEKRMEK